MNDTTAKDARKGNYQRIAKHLYQCCNRTSEGLSAMYYARFRCQFKKKARVFALGSDLAQAKIELKKLEIKNSENHDFDLDKRQAETDAPPKPKDGKTEPWTFAEWCELYPHQIAAKKGTGGKRLNKDKRSFADEQRMTKLHLLPYFGAMSLIEISRKSLTDNSSQREAETIIRQGKASSHKVKPGTVANELSLLKNMLRVAVREGYKAVVPSFDELIERSNGSGRALTRPMSRERSSLCIRSGLGGCLISQRKPVYPRVIC